MIIVVYKLPLWQHGFLYISAISVIKEKLFADIDSFVHIFAVLEDSKS